MLSSESSAVMIKRKSILTLASELKLSLLTNFILTNTSLTLALLASACLSDNLHDLEILIQNNVDVNISSRSDGDIPLILAADEGHTTIVKRLLAAGANPNIVNKRDESALMYAAFKGHTAIVELLLTAGADPNAADESGCTAMGLAVGHGHLAAVKALLAAGVNVNTIIPDHGTVSSWLIKNGEGDFVNKLSETSDTAIYSERAKFHFKSAIHFWRMKDNSENEYARSAKTGPHSRQLL
jgi:ankyrin repeat protein